MNRGLSQDFEQIRQQISHVRRLIAGWRLLIEAKEARIARLDGSVPDQARPAGDDDERGAVPVNQGKACHQL